MIGIGVGSETTDCYVRLTWPADDMDVIDDTIVSEKNLDPELTLEHHDTLLFHIIVFTFKQFPFLSMLDPIHLYDFVTMPFNTEFYNQLFVVRYSQDSFVTAPFLGDSVLTPMVILISRLCLLVLNLSFVFNQIEDGTELYWNLFLFEKWSLFMTIASFAFSIWASWFDESVLDKNKERLLDINYKALAELSLQMA